MTRTAFLERRDLRDYQYKQGRKETDRINRSNSPARMLPLNDLAIEWAARRLEEKPIGRSSQKDWMHGLFRRVWAGVLHGPASRLEVQGMLALMVDTGLFDERLSSSCFELFLRLGGVADVAFRSLPLSFRRVQSDLDSLIKNHIEAKRYERAVALLIQSVNGCCALVTEGPRGVALQREARQRLDAAALYIHKLRSASDRCHLRLRQHLAMVELRLPRCHDEERVISRTQQYGADLGGISLVEGLARITIQYANRHSERTFDYAEQMTTESSEMSLPDWVELKVIEAELRGSVGGNDAHVDRKLREYDGTAIQLQSGYHVHIASPVLHARFGRTPQRVKTAGITRPHLFVAGYLPTFFEEDDDVLKYYC